MATPEAKAVTAEEFKLMAERAGLGMSPEELNELKPMYDLYAQYIQILHSVDLQSEEIGVAFRPDWSAT